jgi:ABC-type oligopeptide transport system substrate-binding subunit
LFDSASPDNHAAYSSQRIDALLNEAHAERSDGRRLQLYAQAEKAILRDLPVVPIGTFTTHWAAKHSVRGIKFDVMGGFDAADIFLREE